MLKILLKAKLNKKRDPTNSLKFIPFFVLTNKGLTVKQSNDYSRSK